MWKCEKKVNRLIIYRSANKENEDDDSEEDDSEDELSAADKNKIAFLLKIKRSREERKRMNTFEDTSLQNSFLDTSSIEEYSVFPQNNSINALYDSNGEPLHWEFNEDYNTRIFRLTKPLLSLFSEKETELYDIDGRETQQISIDDIVTSDYPYVFFKIFKTSGKISVYFTKNPNFIAKLRQMF